MNQTSNPRVGAGTLMVNEANQVRPEAGCRSITGGKVEFMETVEQTAVREAKEESDLDVTIERLLYVTNHLIPDEQQHWVAPAYLALVRGGQLNNPEPEKAAKFRFFGLDELPENLALTARNAIAAFRSSAQ